MDGKFHMIVNRVCLLKPFVLFSHTQQPFSTYENRHSLSRKENFAENIPSKND